MYARESPSKKTPLDMALAWDEHPRTELFGSIAVWPVADPITVTEARSPNPEI